METEVITTTEKMAVKAVQSGDWERVVFPSIPSVSNPTVVRQSLPLPAGKHYAISTGTSYKGVSKKGNELLFLVVSLDEFGEVSIMVSNDELLKYVEPKTPMYLHTAEPNGNYTTLNRIEVA